jgi:hypothetical protein
VLLEFFFLKKIRLITSKAHKIFVMISYADKAKQGLLRQPRATVFANSTAHSPSSSSSSSNLVDNSNSRSTPNNNSSGRSHKIDEKVTHECDKQEEGFEETLLRLLFRLRLLLRGRSRRTLN